MGNAGQKRERALKKQQRQAIQLDNALYGGGLAMGRSKRDRKPVNYTFGGEMGEDGMGFSRDNFGQQWEMDTSDLFLFGDQIFDASLCASFLFFQYFVFW